MDGDDIYGDLDDFNLGDTISKFEENNKALTRTVEESEKRINILANEVSALNKINRDLKVNISELYKTAKSEIERKNRQIADLRREMDDTLFRRGNKNSSAASDSQDKEELIKQLKKARTALEQKNRIINSLNRELENAKEQKMQKGELKRSASHIDDENDKVLHKRQNNGNFDRDSEHFDESRGHWKSSNRSKEYDERRNRSRTKSPDRRQGFRRNSDFRPVNDRRLNKLKGTYGARDQCKDRQNNNRFNYNKHGYDHRKFSNSHSRSPDLDRQPGKGQSNKFNYCNNNSAKFSNKSETSYNSRISIDDRRHASPACGEKIDELVQNAKPGSIKLQNAADPQPEKCQPPPLKTSHENKKYRRENLEEGEFDSTMADSHENRMNANKIEGNIPINSATCSNNDKIRVLKEDIRNIVTVEDILQETEPKDNSMDTSKTESVISDKTTKHIFTVPRSNCNTTGTSSGLISKSSKTNNEVKLKQKSSTATSTSAEPTQHSIDVSLNEPPSSFHIAPSTSKQLTPRLTDLSLSDPPSEYCTESTTSKQSTKPSVDASLSEPPPSFHIAPSTSKQLTQRLTDVSVSHPPSQYCTESTTSEQSTKPSIDASLSEPPPSFHIARSTSKQLTQLPTDASVCELPPQHCTVTSTSEQPTKSSMDTSPREPPTQPNGMLPTSVEPTQNPTQLLVKRKLTGKRRRCVITLT